MELDYSVEVTDEEDGTIDNGIDPKDVNVSIDFLERGADISEIIIGHQAQASFSLRKNLITGSDCLACHQEDTLSIGPSYQKIATKYANEPGSREYLIKKVKEGGGGVWGEVAMAAHPQLTDNELGMMIDYVLSIGGETAGGAPYEGTYRFDRHIGKGFEGSYVLNASYTDRGGDQIGPLTNSDIIVLQYPIIQAANFDASVKGTKFKVEAGAAPGVEEDMTIVMGENGTELSYYNIDFTHISSITLSIGQFPSYFTGGDN